MITSITNATLLLQLPLLGQSVTHNIEKYYLAWRYMMMEGAEKKEEDQEGRGTERRTKSRRRGCGCDDRNEIQRLCNDKSTHSQVCCIVNS